MTALYLHIPFCRSKCAYCAFSSWPGRESLHQRYCAALGRELTDIAKLLPLGPLDTLFIGGGTPTVLAAPLLLALVHRCRELFGLADGGEFTIEANPGTLDLPLLQSLHRAGLNRLSLGVQSFHDEELQLLGRWHSADEAGRTIDLAQKAGFSRISLDLMYGLPGQTLDSWRHSLALALATGVEHLSLYQLSLEEGTVFAEQYQEYQPPLPDEETVLAMDGLAAELCAAAGLRQYEISNFARPGAECRHNINYWENEAYLAAGAGAVSYQQGTRAQRLASPEDYCQAIETDRSALASAESLPADQSFRETVVMGLRLTEGIARERLRERFGIDLGKYYQEVLPRLHQQGLIELTASHLSLTATGRRLANQVLAELV